MHSVGDMRRPRSDCPDTQTARMRMLDLVCAGLKCHKVFYWKGLIHKRTVPTTRSECSLIKIKEFSSTPNNYVCQTCELPLSFLAIFLSLKKCIVV